MNRTSEPVSTDSVRGWLPAQHARSIADRL